ncbi:MAG TPA: hypothetical protein DER09_00420 [Prolixibacteraceae bacterium]|nr:hypothetical protein [Prolixibacteraceae bacterium]
MRSEVGSQEMREMRDERKNVIELLSEWVIEVGRRKTEERREKLEVGRKKLKIGRRWKVNE